MLPLSKYHFLMILCSCVRLIYALPVDNATDLTTTTTATGIPSFYAVSPVVGRIKWCINANRQQWEHLVNLSAGQFELILKQSGKFQCPEANQTQDMSYCCGELGEQYCCKLTDTPGLKWGVAVGVIVTFIVFLTVSYTIQFFRVCDRCYHECPNFSFDPEDQEFQLDTRWYTVSHEGNRYGVTFHSRTFAKEFMQCLEANYGRWNTANILKIPRDGQDFVILNIFFHDIFTPWFYTQGPIKNDEEWIRTDFKKLCQIVQAKITVKPCCNPKNGACCIPIPQTRPTQGPLLSTTITTEGVQQSNAKQSSNLERVGIRGSHKWVPWTKAPYNCTVSHEDAHNFRQWKRNSSRYKKAGKTEKSNGPPVVNMIICEDIIECNGLEKGVQTRQKHVQTKQDKLTIPDI